MNDVIGGWDLWSQSRARYDKGGITTGPFYECFPSDLSCSVQSFNPACYAPGVDCANTATECANKPWNVYYYSGYFNYVSNSTYYTTASGQSDICATPRLALTNGEYAVPTTEYGNAIGHCLGANCNDNNYNYCSDPLACVDGKCTLSRLSTYSLAKSSSSMILRQGKTASIRRLSLDWGPKSLVAPTLIPKSSPPELVTVPMGEGGSIIVLPRPVDLVGTILFLESVTVSMNKAVVSLKSSLLPAFPCSGPTIISTSSSPDLATLSMAESPISMTSSLQAATLSTSSTSPASSDNGNVPASSSTGLSISDRISLGVGLGVGLSGVILTGLGVYFAYQGVKVMRAKNRLGKPNAAPVRRRRHVLRRSRTVAIPLQQLGP